MPRTNITEFSNVASENTDINSVNIAENCPASTINDALREIMKALKDVDTGSQALTALSVTGDLTVDTSTLKVDSTNNRVGIGTASPAVALETSGDMAVSDTSTASKRLQLSAGASEHTINSANYGSDMMDLNIQAENTIFKNGLIGVAESMKIDSAGHITKPLQPAFLARVASSQVNLTINTDTTIVFGTEVFDQNSDFDGTSTFTAPVTGKYQFNINTRMESLDSATSFYETKIVTSNFEFRDIFDPRQLNGDLGVYHSSFAIFTDMDANDTCIIKIKPHNSGSSQADVSTNHMNFSGYLVC